MAARDHALAVALSEGRTVSASSQRATQRRDSVGSSQAGMETESICEVMSNLASLSVTADRPEKDKVRPSSSKTGPPDRCVSCMEQPEAGQALFRPNCDHLYCQKCVRDLFLAASKDEELYPPRCCINVFPPALALQLLSYKEIAVFCAKAVEFSSNTRTYCGDPTRFTFIPPWKITKEMATCPQCEKTTHTVCRSLQVDVNHECPLDVALQEVLALGEAKNWKRCPKCCALIELGQGCNHITCK